MSANFWQGKQIKLRAVESSDWEAHYEWDQDTEMYSSLDRIYFPRSQEAAKQHWLEHVVPKATNKGDDFHFEIENLAGELVGSIATDGCNSRVGIFSYGIAIRREYQRNGYASEAIAIVLRYYFEELRYQKVNVQIHSYNEPSIELHKRLNFQPEGRLRRVIYTKGQHFDLLLYGLNIEEFTTSS